MELHPLANSLCACSRLANAARSSDNTRHMQCGEERCRCIAIVLEYCWPCSRHPILILSPNQRPHPPGHGFPFRQRFSSQRIHLPGRIVSVVVSWGKLNRANRGPSRRPGRLSVTVLSEPQQHQPWLIIAAREDRV